MEPRPGGGTRLYLLPFFLTALGALSVAEVMFLLVPSSWSATTTGRILIFWPVMFAIVYVGARLFTRQSERLAAEERLRHEALGHVQYLQATNDLLRMLASSQNLTGSLQELAARIRAIVPCDRVGLALLTEDGQGFRTYTARAEGAPDGPGAMRPDLYFNRRATLLDLVASTRAPRIIEQIGEHAADALDANVLHSAGFVSAILLPLVFEGEVFGTLNLVSRLPGAFSQRDVQSLVPVAEALGTAYAARRLVTSATRHQAAEDIAALILLQVSDINGAVQAIVGQCELMLQECADPAIQRDATLMLRQGRRISDALAKLQQVTAANS